MLPLLICVEKKIVKNLTTAMRNTVGFDAEYARMRLCIQLIEAEVSGQLTAEVEKSERNSSLNAYRYDYHPDDWTHGSARCSS